MEAVYNNSNNSYHLFECLTWADLTLCDLIWITLFAQQYYEVTIGIWKDQQKNTHFSPSVQNQFRDRNRYQANETQNALRASNTDNSGTRLRTTSEVGLWNFPIKKTRLSQLPSLTASPHPPTITGLCTCKEPAPISFIVWSAEKDEQPLTGRTQVKKR